MKHLFKIIASILLVSSSILLADSMQELESRVIEHELENGMRFIIFERQDAPLISFVIAVDAGAVNEVTNKTGIAHFLEHLAFKGSETVGTTNYRAESRALEELDAAFMAYYDARQTDADPEVVDQLYAVFLQKQEEASSYVNSGEFGNLYSRNGGVGLNAATSYDYTVYVVTLPSNRFELWAAMESDRMGNPVFRELYEERDVILEERRMRTDNSPRGLFYEEFNAVTYKAHPYGRPIIGHFSDMQNLSRDDVREFYETYYVPQNMTAAIVGDVDAEEIIPIIDAYFSRIPRGPDSPALITEEPLQPGIRRMEMKMGMRPMLMMSFITVPEGHPDEAALNLLGTVIGNGRTSRLYRSLVEEQKLASYVWAYHSASRYSGEFNFGGYPMEGINPGEVEDAILAELEELVENPVTQQELNAARARLKVRYYGYLGYNRGMAYNLALSDHVPGGWRSTFRYMEEIENLTPEDLMEVADRYIDFDHRTVGILEAEND